jgi:hypothetical protein
MFYFSLSKLLFWEAGRAQVGIATRAGWQGFDSRQGEKIFLFSMESSPALGPTQSPIQWVPAALSQGVKRQGREADHSHHLVPRLGMVELYLHFSICLHGIVLNYIIKYGDNFTLAWSYCSEKWGKTTRNKPGLLGMWQDSEAIPPERKSEEEKRGDVCFFVNSSLVNDHLTVNIACSLSGVTKPLANPCRKATHIYYSSMKVLLKSYLCNCKFKFKYWPVLALVFLFLQSYWGRYLVTATQ